MIYGLRDVRRDQTRNSDSGSNVSSIGYGACCTAIGKVDSINTVHVKESEW